MIAVSDFKSHFTRDFPYLPLWVDGKAYFKGDIVYVAPNFYVSLIDGNTNPVVIGNNWAYANVSTDNYLLDGDITKAISEAELAFADGLFSDDDATIPQLYLTAFYLVMDIKNSSAGLSSTGYSSFISSKSVGGVSESYAIPNWVNDNPVLGLYMTNGYGQKYLTYILPRMRAQSLCILSEGATTP